MKAPSVSLKVKVNTSNLTKASKFKTINKILDDTAKAINKGAINGAENTANFIRTRQADYLRMGGHRHTGELMGSLSARGGGLSYEIGSTLTGYSPSVIEYGRGAVRPVRAKCLHFFTKYGDEVFTTYSRPFQADPYVKPSARDGAKYGVKYIVDAINHEL